MPERLRAARRARRADAAPAARRLRARPPAGRAPAAVPAPRPRAQPRLAALAGGSGCRAWPPATSTRTRARARAAAGRVRGAAPARDAGRLGAACGAATTRTCWPPRGDGGALRRPPRRGGRDRARWPSGCASTSRSDLGYRYPARRTTDADAELAELCRARVRRALPARRHRPRAEARARLEEELRVIAGARPVGLLPPAPRPARARARGGGRGARAATRRAPLLPPGRGPRVVACPRSSATSPASRTSTRSRNELFLGRFLNEELTALPDIDLDFPRDVREVADPARARALRDASARRSSPRSRPSARAARSASSARRSGLPPGEIERVARGGGGRSAARRRCDHDVDVGAGRGTRATGRWAWLVAARRARPTGCRATSPSTRAG